MGMNVTVFEKDSNADCWVNTLKGKNVLITTAVAANMGTGLFEFSGKYVRMDVAEYRKYVVLEQKSGKILNVNIDHIMIIEEAK